MASNGVIISAVIVTAGSGFIVGVSKGQAPSFNQFLGAGFMGAFLFAVDAINDNLGRLLSELIILGVILRNGDTLFGWVSNSSTAKPVTAAATNGKMPSTGPVAA